MNYLKSKYINHLTPGLIFKEDNYGGIHCVVNNKKVLYTLYRDNGDVYTRSQNGRWNENYYKLVLADKKLLKKLKL